MDFWIVKGKFMSIFIGNSTKNIFFYVNGIDFFKMLIRIDLRNYKKWEKVIKFINLMQELKLNCIIPWRN